jgi:glycerophosphoryl diester phosphodiesterase
MIIVAHRGGAAELGLPENSAAAFAASRFPNECDVHASSDGEAVVIHDPTLDRTTSLSGKVADFNTDELARVIPLLNDVAHCVTYVEIKPPDALELVQRVVKIMAGRDWLLQSFDEQNLVHALNVDPSIRVAFLVDEPARLEIALDRRWPAYLNHELIDDRSAERIRDAGLPLGAWTVNTEEELYRVLPSRPDVIISDVPRLIRLWLERSGVRCSNMPHAQ